MANDVDESPADTLKLEEPDPVSEHGAIITDNGDGTYTYDPSVRTCSLQGLNSGETEEDWFVYRISDDDGGIDEGVVLITVDGRPDSGVIHVDDSATGTNDGSSWENAYLELQQALHTSWSGQEIHVAAGTYYPDFDPATGSYLNSRLSTFTPNPGVKVLGGFPDGGGNSASRNPRLNLSVLDGDIDVDVDHDSDHIMTLEDLGSSTVIDGFLIRNGNNRTTNSGEVPYGAGMWIMGGSPILRNLTFQGNQARGGGAVFIENEAAPVIANCVFISNHALHEGGGAIRISSSSPHLINCRFTGNSSLVGNGGALYMEGQPSGSGLQISHCTFTLNSALASGGAIYTYSSPVDIANSLFWDNSAETGDEISMFVPDPASRIQNTLIKGSGGSGLFSWTLAPSLDGGGNIDSDPDFIDLEQRIGPASPARDAAALARLPADLADMDEDGDTSEPVPFDLDGNPREDPTGSVDMGTFEAQSAPALTLVSGIQPGLILAKFNTTMGLQAAQPSTYTLSGTGAGNLAPQPEAVQALDGSTFLLSWASGRMRHLAPVTITVSAFLTDLSGNPVPAGRRSQTDPTGGRGTPPRVMEIAHPGHTADSTVTIGVSFTADVTGVDVSDFVAITDDTITGASVVSVAPVSASEYEVVLNTGSGEGVLFLQVMDDDSITDGFDVLGGAGSNNGTARSQPLFIDHTAPVVTVDSLVTADTNPGLSGTVDDPGAIVEITVGTVSLAAQVSPEGVWRLADNSFPSPFSPATYDVIAGATDAAGNTAVDNTSGELTIVADGLTAALESPPADPSNSAVLESMVTGDRIDSFQFRLNEGSWSSEISASQPLQLSAIPDGEHLLEILGFATNGEAQSSPTHYRWTVDTTPPTKPILLHAEPAQGSRNASSVSLHWAGSTDALSGMAGYAWLIDTHPENHPGSVVQGSSPPEQFDLTEGLSLYLHLVGIDAAGNVSAVLHEGPWEMDTIPPVANFEDTPSDPSSSTSPSFMVGGEGVTEYAFLLDADPSVASQADWSGLAETHPVADPINLSDLTDGPHEIALRGIDAAGNWQSTPTFFTWTVDTDPPMAVLVSPPADPGLPDPDPVEVAGEGVTSYVFRIDSGTWTAPQPVLHPITLTGLSEGPHLLEVKGIDNAGNEQTTPTAHSWTVDNTLPTGTVTALVSAEDRPLLQGTVHPSDASVRVLFPDGTSDATVLTDGSWSLDPGSGDPFAEGVYEIEATFTSRAGRINPEAASASLTIDRTAPDAPSLNVSVPSMEVPSTATSITLRWNRATDNLTEVTGYAWVADASPDTLPSGPVVAGPPPELIVWDSDEDRYLHIYGVDEAGNLSAVAHFGPWLRDRDLPTVTVDTITTTNPFPVLSGTWSDDHGEVSIELTLNGQTGFAEVYQDGTWYWDGSLLANALVTGSHELLASVTDLAGRAATDPSQLEVGVVSEAVEAFDTANDYTGPDLSAFADGGSGWNGPWSGQTGSFAFDSGLTYDPMVITTGGLFCTDPLSARSIERPFSVLDLANGTFYFSALLGGGADASCSLGLRGSDPLVLPYALTRGVDGQLTVAVHASGGSGMPETIATTTSLDPEATALVVMRLVLAENKAGSLEVYINPANLKSVDTSAAESITLNEADIPGGGSFQPVRSIVFEATGGTAAVDEIRGGISFDSVIPTSALQFETSSLSDAVAGAAYAQLLQASGGSGQYTWSLVGSTNPGWVSLDGNQIIGLPSDADPFTNSIYLLLEDGDDSLVRELPLQLQGTGNLSPAEWAQLRSLSGDLESDATGNGRPDLIDWAFGEEDTATHIPRLLIHENADGDLVCSFPRRKGRADHYRAEYAHSLASGSWETAPIREQQFDDLGNGFYRVNLVVDVPLGPGSPLFVRIHVSE